MSRRILAANWKMNYDRVEAMQLFRDVLRLLGKRKLLSPTPIILNVPFPYIGLMSPKIGDHHVLKLGAQNIFHEDQGAYTGEVSPKMVKSVGAQYCIIGHSERRTIFNEDSDIIALKLQLCLKYELKPIFCVGETAEIKENGDALSYIENQLQILWELKPEQMRSILIAYEPVWAIGTGVSATPMEIQEAHNYIRSRIQNKFSKEIADQTTILYGGSISPQNALSIFQMPDVDGGLVGTASLEAQGFLKIYDCLI